VYPLYHQKNHGGAKAIASGRIQVTAKDGFGEGFFGSKCEIHRRLPQPLNGKLDFHFLFRSPPFTAGSAVLLIQ
jgi:hypothetical protein